MSQQEETTEEEEEREIKRRNRMSTAESQLVSKVFGVWSGEWEMIMRDERIQALGQSKEYLATHLANKRKRLRKKAALADDAVAPRATKRVKQEKTSAASDVHALLLALQERQESLELQVAGLQGELEELRARVCPDNGRSIMDNYMDM